MSVPAWTPEIFQLLPDVFVTVPDVLFTVPPLTTTSTEYVNKSIEHVGPFEILIVGAVYVMFTIEVSLSPEQAPVPFTV